MSIQEDVFSFLLIRLHEVPVFLISTKAFARPCLLQSRRYKAEGLGSAIFGDSLPVATLVSDEVQVLKICFFTVSVVSNRSRSARDSSVHASGHVFRSSLCLLFQHLIVVGWLTNVTALF